MASAGESKSVRLVCFDLGGVLIRIVRDWKEACERAGVDPILFGPEVLAPHSALMVRYETGLIDEAGYFKEVPVCVPDVPIASIKRVFDAWLLATYDGAVELIKDLRARGYQTACLSNTNHRHWRMLKARPELFAAVCPLDDHFLSFEIRVMKPAAGAYEHVERSTGFKGSQILFFDDKSENVEGARARGWEAERVSDPEDAVGQMRGMLEARGILD